ncbi:MAG: UDP-3-O-(3-hydroxymyristoyl)glucosamine N-acyltransferase [Sulfurospirillaceae bacterium]|nr:UDP-3-O-(3-hydroxymyristoyl)glucosamine N-acyltransferase [Sulfurospirillaceae bacterium]
MKLSQLAAHLNLTFNGNDFEVTSLSSLKEATSSQITYLENITLLPDLQTTKAGAVLVSEQYQSYVPKTCIALVSSNPHLSMAYASAYFAKSAFDISQPSNISEQSIIAPNVTIGSYSHIEEGTYIMPHVTIGANVFIGKNVTIYPNVVIYDNSVIKDGCIIQAGAIIGSDGFSYAHTAMGEHIKIYHSGNIILEENVEIGANTTIDRAVFGTTILKKGTKIDNLVQVGHNCVIGENSILVSQSGLAGSTILGRNVIMGGQSATAGHTVIGDFAMIAARGGVTKSIEGGKTYGGFPLMQQHEWLKMQAKIARFFKKKSKD